jgi:hypothetical protein
MLLVFKPKNPSKQPNMPADIGKSGKTLTAALFFASL